MTRALAAAEQDPAACGEDAQKFWQTFRGAALKGQAEKIADLSVFPFELRGTLDGDPPRKLTRVEFARTWPSLLNSDPGVTAKATSMRAFIKLHVRLLTKFCEVGGRGFRVGNWVFEIRPDGWRFVRAFSGD
jgi:hypothetical protein